MVRLAAHIILLISPGMALAHKADTTGLAKFIHKSELGGFVRSFTMATVNEGKYRDFVSSALGGGFHYYSPVWKGFRAGTELLVATELFSNDLLKPDPASGSTSKWEMELYDIETPENRTALYRLNKAFIEFAFKGSLFRFGRQTFNTPVLNTRDGRMMPFQHGGLYMRFPELGKLQSEIGLVRSVSVRSTMSWYDFQDALGMVSRGKTETGETANYRYKTNSNGLAFAKLNWKNSKGLSIEVWDFYLDNLNNTLWTQAEQSHGEYEIGAQFVAQAPALNPCEEYLQGSGESYTGSVRLLRKFGKGRQLSLNATRISRAGKFLFPRELGRESFYTSLSRSRMEGLGGTGAYSIHYSWRSSNRIGFEQNIQFAYYDVPNAYEFGLNKYELADYLHLNIQSLYEPSFADGRVQLEFLYVYKHNLSKEVTDPRLIVNKTNFNQFNFIINAFF